MAEASNDPMQPDPESLLPESDLSKGPRTIWVVTTAALPWRTGTAVNPLLRALYLTHSHDVTLVIPWVQEEESRQILYKSAMSKEEQEEWIRDYCRNRALCPEEEKKLKILFYDGVYHHSFGSIFPSVDICSLISPDESDVAILEEPEHLNWFRNGDSLGWMHQFKYVVGILHTNYGSYIQLYGMAASYLTAGALHQLSRLVCKAYCHRLIRLSDTLPPLVKRKEVTSNVHGVRDEFFACQEPGSAVNLADSDETLSKCAAVYFIGKLIWAKGFHDVLRLQDAYRDATGDYFAMDVYGGGNDEESIKRACFGRKGQERELDGTDEAADIFDRDESLRTTLRLREEQQSSMDSSEDEGVAEQALVTKESVDKTVDTLGCGVPLDVVADLSKRTIGTGIETVGAAYQLVQSALNVGFGSFQRGKKEEDDSEVDDRTRHIDEKKPGPRRFHLGPVLATYKWRRTPLPARFLGSKDHIELKRMPQKIFLNMSTSEVLCTTTAEALAMGKFVIIPKHPSNTFFLQFPNCLAYENLDECVEKLKFALTNNPEPLSDSLRRVLSWEGAIQRLYEASAISHKVAEETLTSKLEKDTGAAKTHVNGCKQSKYVTNLFSGLSLDRK